MLIIVFGTLTTFSLMWKKKNQGYKNLEKELVTKVEGYFEQEHKYPTGIEVVTIDLKELQEHDIIQELKSILFNEQLINILNRFFGRIGRQLNLQILTELGHLSKDDIKNLDYVTYQEKLEIERKRYS